MQSDLSSYFFSLTTDINRVSQKPLVAVAALKQNVITNNYPVRVDSFFLFLLFMNPLSSPDIDCSDKWRTAGNVGVHSCLG